MLTYDEMVEKTREFYDELQIDISDKYVDLAVRSLTMPQYAKEFNDKFHKEIKFLNDLFDYRVFD